jgi:phenylacetate-CoA ligase
MFGFPEVIDYLVEVDRTGDKGFRITIEVASARDNPELRQKIEKEMGRALIFISPRVSFVKEGTLPRYEGKSKRIIVS